MPENQNPTRASMMLEPELLFIETPEGDCAFYVNGQSIATAESGTDDIPDNVKDIANNIVAALGLPMRKVELKLGETSDRAWFEMYNQLKLNEIKITSDAIVDSAYA